MNIHPLAIVSPKAQLGRDVSIGPFAVIESDVVIGDACQVASHAIIKDGTRLGSNNMVHESAVLGGLPQHVNKPDRPGLLVIGSSNTIREFVTLHRAMKSQATTAIGDNNLFMVGSHVAHDCRLGNHIIFANDAAVAGHVTVDDRAFLSGGVGVHQFCRVGRLAMVSGHAKVVQDVPPYLTIDGASGCAVGLNLVGLRRAGFTAEQIVELKTAYRIIYRHGLKWSDVLKTLRQTFATGPATEYHEFLSTGKRGFVQERRMPPHTTLKLRGADEETVAMPTQLRSKAG